MSVKSSNLDIVLEKWYAVKREISELEKKRDKYKNLIENIMKEKKIGEVKGNKYKARMIRRSREFMKRGNVPDEIWEKFRTVVEFETMIISKRKRE